MGSTSSIPLWSKINKTTETYSRELIYINGNNEITKHVFNCDIKKIKSGELITIWDINFKVAKFEEECSNNILTFKNTYHADSQGIVRKSLQYHSETLGYITIERLDQ